MAVWLTRAGAHGEREDFALEHGVAAIGWDEVPDLAGAPSRAEVEKLLEVAYPQDTPQRRANHSRQLWAFKDTIHEGDLVVLPLKQRAAIAIGRVTGPYQYQSKNPQGARHTRPVEWIQQDLPRTKFDQDLLYSLGAFLTVCRIERNKAEERIRAILKGGGEGPRPEPEDGEGQLDVEEYARDQIRTFIAKRFRGHELARLVTAILNAQGYRTQTSSPGADGGVDVVAGHGAMGFDTPRICVQVKSSDQAENVNTLRELQGVMKNFGAQQGLLVAWGGFKKSVHDEARRHFFEIRLWDAGDLVDALLRDYDNLPEDIQAELPLKRVWTLVTEE